MHKNTSELEIQKGAKCACCVCGKEATWGWTPRRSSYLRARVLEPIMMGFQPAPGTTFCGEHVPAERGAKAQLPRYTPTIRELEELLACGTNGEGECHGALASRAIFRKGGS